MAGVKHRIGLGTIGPSIPGKNDITAKTPVGTDDIFTADSTMVTADSTVHYANGGYP